MGGSATVTGDKGGIRGTEGVFYDGHNGKDGTPGKGLKGKAVGDAASVKESDDNKSWSVAKSNTSDKQYVKVTLVVTNITLDKSIANLHVDGVQSLTATLSPEAAEDRTVKWSVAGTAVKLYSDPSCKNEVGTKATDARSVYVKGVELGSMAAVIVQSNTDDKPTVVNAGYQVVLRDVLDDEYDLTGLYGYDAQAHTITRKIEVTINKAPVTAPAIASKTFTGQVQKADVPSNSLYTVADNDGGTEVGEYNVLLKLVDSFNYKWSDSNKATETLKFRITPAKASTVVVPTPEAVTYDPETTLANVPLTEGWKWVTEAIVPTVINDGYPAALEVDDTNYDYTGVEGYDAETHAVTRTLALTVNKAGCTPAAVDANRVAYDGTEHPPRNRQRHGRRRRDALLCRRRCAREGQRLASRDP